MTVDIRAVRRAGGRGLCFALLLATGCAGLGDGDLDGFSPSQGDCDDLDATIFPGATETCDGKDNNCSGETDEGFDVDADGFYVCDTGADGLLSTADCDDGDATVYPGADEIWGDGVDGDCDGIVDGDRYVVVGAAPEAGKPTYTNLQAAIDDALEGEVIAVGEGDWVGGADFVGKDIKLVAMGERSLTVLSGTQGRSTVRLTGGEPAGAWVKGFTIRGGDGELAAVCGHHPELTHGGAVCIQGGAPTLYDNVITGGGAGFGGGIYIFDATPRIEGNELRANRATWGGAVFVYDASPLLLRNEVHDNVATADGGAVGVEAGYPRLRHNLIESNQARNGGGIYLDAADPTLDNNRILDNEASADGGGIMGEGSGGQWVHNHIADNLANNGGGVYLFGSIPTLSTSVLTRNQARAQGGGIHLTQSSDADLNHLSVVANLAVEGGGIYAAWSAFSLYDSIFAFNAAESSADNALLFAGDPDMGYNFFSSGGTFNGYSQSDPTQATASEAGIVGANLERGDLTGDPMFVNSPTDGDLTDDDYRLLEDSPAVDAGQEESYGGDLDPDEGRSDQGAFGGPDAAGWDLDGDGAPQWWSPGTNTRFSGFDCDDMDAEVYPGRRC